MYDGSAIPELESKYVLLRKPDHPMSNSSGYVLEHRAVLYEAIGPGEHACRWCDCTVTWEVRPPALGGLVVDHLNGFKNDNRVENLAPSCAPCNSGRWAGYRQRGYLRDRAASEVRRKDRFAAWVAEHGARVTEMRMDFCMPINLIAKACGVSEMRIGQLERAAGWPVGDEFRDYRARKLAANWAAACGAMADELLGSGMTEYQVAFALGVEPHVVRTYVDALRGEVTPGTDALYALPGEP